VAVAVLTVVGEEAGAAFMALGRIERAKAESRSRNLMKGITTRREKKRGENDTM
jgi:hypothetical protein